LKFTIARYLGIPHSEDIHQSQLGLPTSLQFNGQCTCYTVSKMRLTFSLILWSSLLLPLLNFSMHLPTTPYVHPILLTMNMGVESI
jgi:hypothetical protein